MSRLYAFETEQFWSRAAGLFITVHLAAAYLAVSVMLLQRDARRTAIEAGVLAATLTMVLPLIQLRLTQAVPSFPNTGNNESTNRFRLFIEIAGFVSLASCGAVAALAIFTSDGSLDAVKRHLFEGTVFIVFLFRFLGPVTEYLRERRSHRIPPKSPPTQG